MKLHLQFVLPIFLIIFLVNPSLKAQNKIQDTCFYSIEFPPNIDLPSTPHFDTTLIRNTNCSLHIILWSDCGTEAKYALFKGDSINFNSHHTPIRSSHVFHGQEGKMDITKLSAGSYTVWLVGDCNGGFFTIHIK